MTIPPVHAADPAPANPLIAIAGGSFLFGNDDGEDNEHPAQRLELPPFRIQKFEVSNAEYAAFVAETGHRPGFYANHPELGKPENPVVGVSWDDAQDFCLHYGLRLPSEQQWERAARGATGRLYAWGNEPPTPDRVNRGADTCCSPDDADGFAATAPVGSFTRGATPEGVMDLTGNVWEWVDGWYNPYDAPPAAREQEFRVLRGGAWNSDGWRLRTAYRLAYRGDFRYASNGGFRCVADP